MHYRLTGYGDYQVSDLFSTWKLSMLVEPTDMGYPRSFRDARSFEIRCDVSKLAQMIVVLTDQAIVWLNGETRK